MAQNVDLFANRVMEPDNPRTSMEPSDMEPDDARQFMHDLVLGIHERAANMEKELFHKPDGHTGPLRDMERAKQYYGNDRYQILSGIQAALREWDESGREVQELKEKYGGKFVEGVEIGERLAVYEGSDFEFTAGTSSGADENESGGKFTFTE
jgi:hypothetical protein